MRNAILLLALGISFCQQTYSQSLERQVLSSFGSLYSGSLHVFSNAGEAVIETMTSGSFHLTQGFEQPFQTELSIPQILADEVSYKLYPSPAQDIITLELFSPSNNQFGFSICNHLGQIVMQPVSVNINGTHKQNFDISGFASGNYYFTITTTGYLYKSIPYTKF